MIRLAFAILFLLCALSLAAQLQPTPAAQLYLKPGRVLPFAGAAYAAGFSDGMVELLRNHYYRFERTWPGANAQYWDPRQSWQNKWKNGDPEQGERFFGSSTVFAWSTDAYHLFRTINRTATTVSVTLYLFDEKRPWYIVLLEGAAYWIIRQAGFHTAYTILHQR